MLTVRSPGGFFGGINESNVLSNRSSRSPALADLFRAVGLVEKQGLGVDRMYQEMIVLGHRPPTVREVAGPHIETTLTGGPPVVPMLEIVGSITPQERQEDASISIILYHLLHRPFITLDSLAKSLQADIQAAQTAIQAALQTSALGEIMVRPMSNSAWILNNTIRAKATSMQEASARNVVKLLPYISTDRNALHIVIEDWIAFNGSISTGELMTLSDVSRGTAKSVLEGAMPAGNLDLGSFNLTNNMIWVICGSTRGSKRDAQTHPHLAQDQKILFL